MAARRASATMGATERRNHARTGAHDCSGAHDRAGGVVEGRGRDLRRARNLGLACLRRRESRHRRDLGRRHPLQGARSQDRPQGRTARVAGRRPLCAGDQGEGAVRPAGDDVAADHRQPLVERLGGGPADDRARDQPATGGQGRRARRHRDAHRSRARVHPHRRGDRARAAGGGARAHALARARYRCRRGEPRRRSSSTGCSRRGATSRCSRGWRRAFPVSSPSRASLRWNVDDLRRRERLMADRARS